MKKILIGAMMIVAALFVGPMDSSAQERGYKDGTVTNVTSVKVKPGKYDAYMGFLSSRWKVTMEEAKKQGIVVNYSVMNAQPRTPNDPDLYLVVTYPNMATFDTLTDKMDSISTKLFNQTREQMNQQSAERSDTMREILGSQMLREVILK